MVKRYDNSTPRKLSPKKYKQGWDYKEGVFKVPKKKEYIARVRYGKRKNCKTLSKHNTMEEAVLAYDNYNKLSAKEKLKVFGKPLSDSNEFTKREIKWLDRVKKYLLDYKREHVSSSQLRDEYEYEEITAARINQFLEKFVAKGILLKSSAKRVFHKQWGYIKHVYSLAKITYAPKNKKMRDVTKLLPIASPISATTAPKPRIQKKNKSSMFHRLGENQKAIINKIVLDDYYIVKTLDTRDMSITISLVDDAGNHDRDLTEKELKALFDRGFLLNADVSKCLELVQEKFWINEQYAKRAMNTCYER